MAAKFSGIIVQLLAVWIIQTCCSSCSDHLQGSSGDLRFPTSGGNVGERLQCTWTITVPWRLRVKITFTDFVMKTSCCSCVHDFLEIRDGSLHNSTLIGQFCAKREPKYVFSTRNVIWIQFASNFRTYRGNRFRLSWESVCGSHFTETTGSFTSPGYPLPYQNNKDCIYSIEVPRGRIKVKFESFNVEGRMPVCLYDFLEVKEIGYFELSSTQAESRSRRYCGNEKPPIIYSTRGSNLWFRFKSDLSGGESGFVANYRTISAGEGTCGGTLTDPSGFIYSQNYPYHFPPGQECVWKIRVASDSHVHLYFDTLNFGVNKDGVCDNGFLEIYDGLDDSSHKLGMYCGELMPSKIISRTNQLMIKAVSKLEGESIGWFSLRYESSSRSVCGLQKFTCVNRQCVENHTTCNGKKECDDGSDEEDCHETEEPGFLSWYRFWPVSIIGGMLIVGVWLWRAWKKISAARSEVDERHATTLSPNHIELVPHTAPEAPKPPSYSEAVAQEYRPPPTYEEALREEVNPQNNAVETGHAEATRVNSDINNGSVTSPGNTSHAASMVVYERSSSSNGSPYDTHRRRGPANQRV